MLRRVLMLLVLGSVIGFGLGLWAWRSAPGRPVRRDLARVAARRVNLDLSLVAPGRVESTLKTKIECEVQNLTSLGTGRSLLAGASSILEVVDEGAFVHKGDVLCRLDSSDFAEMVVDQDRLVQEARNNYEKGKLDVLAAEIALREYREGLLPQKLQEHQSQIVLAESDLRRQRDRVDWTRKMVKKRYFSESQYLAEEDRLLRAATTLDYHRGQHNLTRTHNSPVQILKLEVALEQARTTLSFLEMSLRNNESQLRKYQQQVDLCTIRAPHDGMVIYSEDWGMRIEVGLRVYQRMPLFYLPDLNSMEIETELNEAFIERVRPDMKARVKIDALPGQALDGHVVSLSTLPMARRDLLTLLGMSAVRSYTAVVRLHSPPKGLLPGMTAEVEIATGHRDQAVVVPAEAILLRGGSQFCVVETDGGLERREIELGSDARALVEVRSGLEEGERVLVHPSQLTDEEMDQITAASRH